MVTEKPVSALQVGGGGTENTFSDRSRDPGHSEEEAMCVTYGVLVPRVASLAFFVLSSSCNDHARVSVRLSLFLCM